MSELYINQGVEIRNSQLEIHHFQLRIAIASGFVLTMFFLLFVRFFYLQVVQHAYYSTLAEANRIPFDIPEAESELVAGATTEYTGMKFGLLWLSEYMHTLLSSIMGAALFFGGWDGPGPDGPHWLIAKPLLLFASIFWVRWSFMRYRADQLMNLAWKVGIPAGLAVVVTSALWVHLT